MNQKYKILMISLLLFLSYIPNTLSADVGFVDICKDSNIVWDVEVKDDYGISTKSISLNVLSVEIDKNDPDVANVFFSITSPDGDYRDHSSSYGADEQLFYVYQDTDEYLNIENFAQHFEYVVNQYIGVKNYTCFVNNVIYTANYNELGILESYKETEMNNDSITITLSEYVRGDCTNDTILKASIAIVVVVVIIGLVVVGRKKIRSGKLETKSEKMGKVEEKIPKAKKEKKSKKAYDKKIKQQQKELKILQDFKKIMKFSQEIEITRAAKMLNISEDDLNNYLFKWSETLSFKLNKGIIVVEDIDKFLDDLDSQFASWNNNENNNLGKI